ncbi:MAG: CDP-alcohol phosphatidyltransferase family protein [Bacteroidetes bacterium]|nr:CDP-alcohol phosphatidyltransferase family protein [Bacteroidota bacterium]
MSWYSDYKKSLKMVEVEEIFDLFFYRPLAFVLVKIIYPTNITPNQLTMGAIIMGVIGGFFYAHGTPLAPQPFVIGALFFMMFNILDCSDGQLARLKKNGTRTGRIIDGVADYIAVTAIYIGIGIGFANNMEIPWHWWLLLFLTGASNTIHAILVDYYRNRFLDYVLERKSTFEEDLEEFRLEYNTIKDIKSKWFDRAIIGIYIKYMGLQDNLAAKKANEKLFKTTPQEFYNKNKNIIRSWVFLGPTSQVTTLILCSIFNRFDIFFGIMIVGFNLIALINWLIQKNIDKQFK